MDPMGFSARFVLFLSLVFLNNSETIKSEFHFEDIAAKRHSPKEFICLGFLCSDIRVGN